MAKKSKKGEGFHSAAGLIRYFDAEEETAIKIDPRLVLGFATTDSENPAAVNAITTTWKLYAVDTPLPN